MKGGCVLGFSVLVGFLVIGVVASMIMAFDWVKATFGQGALIAFGSMTFAVIIIFTTIAMMGVIFYGVSSLWVSHHSNTSIMISTFFESLATVVKALRLPGGNGAGTMQAPRGPTWSGATVENGLRPGQQALPGGYPMQPAVPYQAQQPMQEPGQWPKNGVMPEHGEWEQLARQYGEVIAR